MASFSVKKRGSFFQTGVLSILVNHEGAKKVNAFGTWHVTIWSCLRSQNITF